MRAFALTVLGVSAALVSAFAACSGEAPTGGSGGTTTTTGTGGDPTVTTSSSTTGPSAEVCGNGLDDDGNGQIDEGCNCQVGTKQLCFPGDPAKAGKGPCTFGTQTCEKGATGEFNEGHFGPCTGAGVPAAETCNGLDDDCNGLVDEVGCGCTPGSSVQCYTGPSGTSGVGLCKAGTQTCAADGSAYGACTGEVTPVAEACGNGVDDDCDGQADEGCTCTPGATSGCYTGPTGTAGVGQCKAGTQTCLPDGSGYGACSGMVTPGTEICGNGLDDDCDGQVDEGCVCVPGSTTSCYTGPGGTQGVGICHGGTKTCLSDGSGYGGCAGEVTPAGESCGNGVDDNCNGQVDEGCVQCSPATVTWNIPAGTTGGPSCITTGGGKCVEAVTCSGQYCSGNGCGQPHCGTLICNDGTYSNPQYCSVISTCTASGIVTTGFSW